MTTVAVNSKFLGVETEKWTHFIATFQLLLSILFVFQALPRLGFLPFSSSQILDEIEEIKRGDVYLACSVLLLLINLMGGAMAMILDDGARESNPIYLRKWIHFAIITFLLTVTIDLVQFKANAILDLHHTIGLGIFILIQSFCIVAVKFHELELSEKSMLDDPSDVIKV